MDIDASEGKSTTPPLRPTKDIEEDDFRRQYRLRGMKYNPTPYPPSPELHFPSPERHPLSPIIAAVASEANQEPQPSLLAIQPPVSCWAPAQSTDSEVSSTQSGQPAEQDRQQLLQQEAHQSSSPCYTVGANQTRPSLQTSGQLPVQSLHRQASVAATAAATTTMDQATQTQTPRPATATTAGPTPTPILSRPIPPEQPASSARSGTNPTTPRASPTVAPPSQQPIGLPTIPSQPHPYQFQPHPYQSQPRPYQSQPRPYQSSYVGLTAPYAMSQVCTPPPYWYCYPGASPGAGYPYSNWNQQSPWYSGTAHYLTSPPPQVPQVYTVEPAYIMPQQQATYYQPATYNQPAAYNQPAPMSASPYYYYVPGAPNYY
ncbi:hypothetical protein F4782DRAFT_547482 [Xylaria castorea]|nr:hypothetical protein F4782DRAFT_547482 [Xylaria castorea]